MQVNKEGADWKLIKVRLAEQVTRLQENMLAALPPEEYHMCRGQILLAKDLIEWVEPSTPPQTTEDNYGISDPSRENYQ